MKKECFECNKNTVEKLSKIIDIDGYDKDYLNRYIDNYLSHVDMNRTNPDVMGDIYKYIRQYLHIHDPYLDIKNNYNTYVLNMYDEIINYINSSSHPFMIALHCAIKGNLIDFGAKHEFSYDMLKKLLFKELKLTIDDSLKLYHSLKQSESLLYLCDNCGEIILDLIFIKYIHQYFPHVKITLALRGEPIINDVCIDDLQYLKIDDYIDVVSNTLNTPGFIYDRADQYMKELFDHSDVVISKGQGNFEGLAGIDKENLYYLFMAKCDIVSDMLGVETMSIVCKKN